LAVRLESSQARLQGSEHLVGTTVSVAL